MLGVKAEKVEASPTSGVEDGWTVEVLASGLIEVRVTKWGCCQSWKHQNPCGHHQCEAPGGREIWYETCTQRNGRWCQVDWSLE